MYSDQSGWTHWQGLVIKGGVLNTDSALPNVVSPCVYMLDSSIWTVWGFSLFQSTLTCFLQPSLSVHWKQSAWSLHPFVSILWNRPAMRIRQGTPLTAIKTSESQGQQSCFQLLIRKYFLALLYWRILLCPNGLSVVAISWDKQTQKSKSFLALPSSPQMPSKWEIRASVGVDTVI